jgi:diguanylate cyclase (GGDEF)-like protein/PAS domain S-box-containing protein
MVMSGAATEGVMPSIAAFPVASAVLDLRGLVTSWNSAAGALFGWSAVEAIGRSFHELTEWGDLEDIERRLRSGKTPHLVAHLRHRDGSGLRLQLSFGRIDDELQTMTGLILVASDLSPNLGQTEGLTALQENAARYEMILETANEGIWLVDADAITTFANQRLADILGRPVEELLGVPLMALVSEEGRSLAAESLARLAGGRPNRSEFQFDRPDATTVWTMLSAAPILEEGRYTGALVMLTDVSERKVNEDQLLHVALHDKLTGLANRSLFGDRLSHTLDRRSGAATVLLLDLDGFKAINDNLGHAAGDAVLVAVAGRLNAVLRPSDSIARFAGDEFSVLLEDAAESGAMEAATRLLDALAAPVQLEGRHLSVQASIGIATGVSGAESADGLLRKAEAAVHAAKGNGGSRWEVFSMQAAGIDADGLTLSNLRSVELGSEMVLHYQPLVDLRDGRLSGFEALLRWNHPTRGLIEPDQFIPIAEASGVIVPIGRWVLDEACRQLSMWQSHHPAAAPLTINVNVSARQLADAHLVEDVAHAIDGSSLDPELVTLEITETMILADEAEVERRLWELKQLGVRISVDDFGTGYSSMGHLERFPVDELKIDRSFVASVGQDGQGSGVALGVLRLARGLRLDVVAEGIERVEQLAELRRAACTTGQGYYFAKALDPSAVESLLQDAAHYSLPESSRLVLLVDDEEALRMLTARILRNAGYEVVEAGTGEEAIRIAEQTRLDAVILDVGLPDMSGFDISERLGGDSQSGVPIIYISGTAIDVDDRVRGLNLGAEAYLTKPVAAQELIAVLGASLRSHGQTNAAS